MRRLQVSALLLLLASPLVGATGTWHVPHPWRAEAVVDGRRIDYGDERFLHVFSYHHGVADPGPVAQGLRGTGGSVDSDTLYYDFRFLRDFPFDNPATGVTLDIQRSVDFDGGYERQLVGIRHDLSDAWGVSLQGDVFSDKSATDVYFGARHRLTGGGWLQAQWVFPDAYFDDKTVSANRFVDRPQTLFFQWHRPADGGRTTVSLNVSPWSELDAVEQGVRVSNTQTRLGVQHWQTLDALQWRLDVHGERTHRHHRLEEDPLRRDFRRDFAEASMSVHFLERQGQPWAGVRYLWLHERGWFGRAVNDAGRVMRKEPMVYGGVHLAMSETSKLVPTVYVSRARVEQSLTGDWSLRDEDQWIGKIALPWQITVRRENAATLTLSPSFRLHRFAFGGGNIQLHWPL